MAPVIADGGAVLVVTSVVNVIGAPMTAEWSPDRAVTPFPERLSQFAFQYLALR